VAGGGLGRKETMRGCAGGGRGLERWEKKRANGEL